MLGVEGTVYVCGSAEVVVAAFGLGSRQGHHPDQVNSIPLPVWTSPRCALQSLPLPSQQPLSLRLLPPEYLRSSASWKAKAQSLVSGRFLKV